MAVPTITDLLQNIAHAIPPLMALITAAMYLAGFTLVFRGMYHLKQYGELRTMMSVSAELKGPIILFFVGATLIFYPTIINTSLQTIFGSANVLAYQPTGSETGQVTQSMRDVGYVLRFIGYLAFFRGWLLVSRMAGQGAQPGTFAKAMTHIIGGIFLVNIFESWDILKNTLGF